MNPTITSIETLACETGWRNCYFVKITTSDGAMNFAVRH